MESIEKKIENYAVVFNVNLVRATLNEASEFKDYLAEAILDTDKDIIVNLSACEHLDSTFLGVLVSSYKRLKNQNRSLVIIEPIDQSSIFLTLNSIGKIFPLYTSVKVALEDIDNKRLLEQEISHLDQNKVNDSSKVENQSDINFQTESLQDETKQNELINESLPEPAYKESSDGITLLEKDISNEEELNLVERPHNEIELENPTYFKTNKSLSEEITNSVEPDEFKERETIKGNHENEIEDSPFGDNVKWEFGFSS